MSSKINERASTEDRFLKHSDLIKILTLCIVLMFLGCRSHSERNKGTGAVKQDDNYEYFVAPVAPQNIRNSEAAIVPLKDGTLLLAWTDFYSDNGADHAPARISGKISKDAGRTWGEEFTVLENDGGCNVMEVNFMRLKNGNLALFYCQKNSESTDCRVMMRTSSDEGKTWINPKQLSPSGKYTGLTNGRSIRLKSGRILLEAWEGGYCYCVISDDEGETWRDSQHIKPAGGECYENACIELKDGNVLMLMRTGLGGQFKSISSDGGEKWSDPVITTLTGTAAPVSISRIPKTDDLLAIWTNQSGVHKNVILLQLQYRRMKVNRGNIFVILKTHRMMHGPILQ